MANIPPEILGQTVDIESLLYSVYSVHTDHTVDEYENYKILLFYI